MPASSPCCLLEVELVLGWHIFGCHFSEDRLLCNQTDLTVYSQVETVLEVSESAAIEEVDHEAPKPQEPTEQGMDCGRRHCVTCSIHVHIESGVGRED